MGSVFAGIRGRLAMDENGLGAEPAGNGPGTARRFARALDRWSSGPDPSRALSGLVRRLSAEGLVPNERNAAAERTAELLGRISGEELARALDASLDSAGAAERFAFAWSASAGESAAVELRERAMGMERSSPGCSALSEALRKLFGIRFGAPWLEMRRLSWSDSAGLLESVVRGDSVRPMSAMEDLRRRLAADREVFSLVSPALPDRALAFLEVALVRELPAGTGDILLGPVEDRSKARWAVFYSIGSPVPGLRGIPLGEELIHRAAASLSASDPGLSGFCTLSPIPGLAAWFDGLSEVDFDELAGGRWSARRAGNGAARDKAAFRAVHSARAGLFEGDLEQADLAAESLAAKFLLAGSGRPADSVARFHFGNGARLLSLAPGGDPSEKGRAESFSVMARYEYDLGKLASNKDRHARGRRSAGWRASAAARVR